MHRKGLVSRARAYSTGHSKIGGSSTKNRFDGFAFDFECTRSSMISSSRKKNVLGHRESSRVHSTFRVRSKPKVFPSVLVERLRVHTRSSCPRVDSIERTRWGEHRGYSSRVHERWLERFAFEYTRSRHDRVHSSCVFGDCVASVLEKRRGRLSSVLDERARRVCSTAASSSALDQRHRSSSVTE